MTEYDRRISESYRTAKDKRVEETSQQGPSGESSSSQPKPPSNRGLVKDVLEAVAKEIPEIRDSAHVEVQEHSSGVRLTWGDKPKPGTIQETRSVSVSVPNYGGRPLSDYEDRISTGRGRHKIREFRSDPGVIIPEVVERILDVQEGPANKREIPDPKQVKPEPYVPIPPIPFSPAEVKKGRKRRSEPTPEPGIASILDGPGVGF